MQKEGKLPRKGFLTLGEIVNANIGISKRDVHKAIEAGILERTLFPGRIRKGKYRYDKVVAVFGLNTESEGT